MTAGSQKASSWTDDLIAKPNGQYRFGSMTIRSSSSTTIINRQTYSLLDWLGDIGGLMDALMYLIQFLLAPYVQHGFKSLILQKFFRLKP